MTVRVRIAPSPTGFAHIGTAHTALFNWLFARHHGGKFIVRVEDTDRNRLVPGAVESIIDMLRFLGLDADEGPYVGGEFGPYFESERLELYNREIHRFIEDGHGYRCYCSSERLAAVNKEKQAKKLPPGYDRHCRFMTEAERIEAEASAVTLVVRLAVPLEGSTVVHDAIRGDVSFDNSTLQDAVLLKSDGFPTYHLAATVDDHAMEITHVMRGDEWLPSTPLHVLIYAGFGWTPPVFAHLPLILGKDKAKLSKRHGDTSFSAFIEQGYLPEALINFLGLLGWSLDDKTEFISRQQFIEHFDIDRIVKNPAVFDFDKLNWMNGQYIRQLPEAPFAELVLHWLEKRLPAALRAAVTPDIVRAIAPLAQTRIERLDQLAPMFEYLFTDTELDYDRATLLGKKFVANAEEAAYALEELQNDLEDIEDWEHATVLEALQKRAESRGMKLGDIAQLTRVAITGRTASPPLTESMEILGKRRSIARLQQAIARLQP